MSAGPGYVHRALPRGNSRPHGWRGTRLFCTAMAALGLTLANVGRATIPAAAKADPRYGLGYLVVTYYPGVTNDGTGDCTAGIQAAIDDSFEPTVLFNPRLTPTGVWLCSSRRAPTRFQIFWSATIGRGPTRVSSLVFTYWSVQPRGGPAQDQARRRGGQYQTTNPPRPMISFRMFHGGQGTPVPVPDPMNAPCGLYGRRWKPVLG